MSSVATRPEGQVTGLSGAQRAAAVMVAVGGDLSAKLMSHLSPQEVEAITLEIATLPSVGPGDMVSILTELRAEAEAKQHLVTGGEAMARAILRKVHGARADEIIDRLLATVQTTPFHFLRIHDPATVAQQLRDEHPQTLALILAHLPAKFGAAVLAGLEPTIQGEVARRVATLNPTAPETIRRLEDALAQRFGSVERHDADHGGVADLAALLNQVDRATERMIMQTLESSDPELAEEVRALMFVFEDIVTLDDRTVQEVLRQVDAAKLALALKGVAADVTACVERNLSERALESLNEEIEVLGPVRVRDVEEAQTEIVRLIRRLEADGTIQIARGDGEFI